MTITYRRLTEFLNAAAQWLNDHKSGHEKFGYALRKVQKAGMRLFEDYNEQRNDLDIEHCMTHANGSLMRDANGALTFDKAGIRARNATVKQLVDATAEIVPFMASSVPADLTPEQQDAFEGLVIPEATGPRLVEAQQA